VPRGRFEKDLPGLANQERDMAFGVRRDDKVEGEKAEKRIVKAITAETLVSLAILGALFAIFAWQMGLAYMFKTMMGTAHDLILNTVFFLMGVIIIAGAFTSLISEFGIVSIANRMVSPLMKPLFGLPGAASIGCVHRGRGNLSVGQPRHHAVGRGQGILEVLQAMAGHDLGESGHSLRDGPHRDDFPAGTVVR
jgi:hypothetical protein